VSLPQHERHWPGWEHDEELAQRYAALIQSWLSRSVDAEALARQWLEISAVPGRQAPGDAEQFLMTASGSAWKHTLGSVLESLWRDGWALGASSALQLMAGSRREKSAPAPALRASEREVRCDAGHAHWGACGAAGLLIRSWNDEGRRLYLFHKRGPDSADHDEWALPGGAIHPDETPLEGAMREAEEELGKLPRMKLRHKVIDDHGNWRYTTHVMDVPAPFRPSVDGKTPDEVGGWGWFTKKEARHLRLHPRLRHTWDEIRHSKHDTVINTALSKSSRYRNPLDGAEPAPLPQSPQQDPASWWAQTQGRLVASGMISTLTGLISEILLELRDQVINLILAVRGIKAVLGDHSRALRIAETEVARAVAQGARQVYDRGHVDVVRWVTAEDGRVCVLCEENELEGPVLLGTPFFSGVTMPPQHPRCRCGLVPAEMPDLAEIGKSALTPMLAATHNPLGPHGLWHTPSKKVPVAQSLPDYVENIAHALIRGGMDEHEAIAMAVAAVKRWAQGNLEWGPYRHVTPEVIRASQEAVRQWYALRASHDGA
jgi:8-oxo-dGTP pyrophosphatase MutT (NUDIX family)